MEESLSYLELMKKTFVCEEVDIKTYSPLTLAFLGDCVFDLVVRTIIVERGNRSANGLHNLKSKIVKAQSQALIIEGLLPSLTEEEAGYYRRGRNTKTYSVAKNATLAEYKKATGFEALIGFLYLTEQMPRILELTKAGLEILGIDL